jgi:hypothetical protein
MDEDVSKSFRPVSITKYKFNFGITRWETTQRAMAAKLTRLTHKIAIQLHLVYLLQFLLQSASPETFGYNLIIYNFYFGEQVFRHLIHDFHFISFNSFRADIL